MKTNRTASGSSALDALIDELKRPTDPDPGLVGRIMAGIAGDGVPIVEVSSRETEQKGEGTGSRRSVRFRALAIAAALAALVWAGTGRAWDRIRGPDARTVRFEVRAPDASVVSVVGDFNDWREGLMPLGRAEGGVWRAEIALPPGRYEYAFRVDGQWRADEEAPRSALNEFGGANSVLIVHGSSQ